MRKLKFPLAAVGASLIFAASNAGAQSSAQIFDYKTSLNACITNDGNPALSSSTCSGNLTGGVGSGSGSGDRVARTASTAGSLTQTGGVNSLAAVVETRGFVYSTLTLSGLIPTQSYVTFNFDVTDFASAVAGASTPAFDYAFEGLYLNALSSGGWHYQQKFVNGQSNVYNDPTVTPVSGGFAYRFGTTSGAGSYNYFYEVATEEYEHAAGAAGTTLSASISARLLSIDLADADGNRLGTAVFDENGAATIDVTPTPEPASVGLLALGLGVVAAGRRRGARRSVE